MVVFTISFQLKLNFFFSFFVSFNWKAEIITERAQIKALSAVMDYLLPRKFQFTVLWLILVFNNAMECI